MLGCPTNLRGTIMPSRIQIFSCLTLLLFARAISAAQVTHGKKPQLPLPYATKSSANAPSKVSPPAGFLPTVPAGFKINVFATGLKRPRWLIVAPNGDIFLADTGSGEIIILRDPQNTGGAQVRENFVTGLTRPFGIAFHDDYVYVGVGSESNVSPGEEPIRAAVTICDPDGKNARQFATGLRNPVGLALEPVTGKVWTAVNERDELGDDLPPDYFTSIKDGGFYGWPYSYIGDNVDARAKPQRPDLVAKAIVPDVLLGAHVAPLQFAFYTGTQFPESYRGGAFVAEHGSWNRSTRSGYQIAFVAFKNGQPSADPVPFMTGLVPDPTSGTVYGRPVGVTVAPDGSLLVSDDGAAVIYRISVAH